MSKATHNGTCQSCGRQQAVSIKTGRLAKHGYTTQWGYFTGTCRGSDNLPLEQDTKLNVETVAAIRDWADEQDAKAAADITKVPVTIRTKDERVWGKVNKRTEWMARAEFEAAHPAYTKFDNAVKVYRMGLERAAVHARQNAKELEELREATFGNPLTARETEDKPQRECFSDVRAAYSRAEQLKEKGIKAVVRRAGSWSKDRVVTYRAPQQAD